MSHNANKEVLVSISVVIPCFLSPPSLVGLVEDLQSHFRLSKTVDSYEILLVADGPESYKTLLELFPQIPTSTSIIQLDQNRGEQIALIAGIMNSTKLLVCTVDDDGQHPASIIAPLLQEKLASQSGLVYGREAGRSQPLVKQVFSLFFKGFVSIFLAPGANQISSVRLFERLPAVDVLKNIRDSTVALDGVLLQIFPKKSSTAVRFTARKEGRSGYNYFSLVNHALNLAMSAARYPLRALFWGGGLATFAGFLLAVIVAFDAIFLFDSLPPWSLLVGLVLVLAGLQFVSTAIVGELVSRLLAEVRGRKLFTVVKSRRDAG